LFVDSLPEFGFALLTNATGLHARPSVKLTQLAKSFSASVELGLSAQGPWLDAKRPVQVMRAKANKGETLYFRASGSDAKQAIAALVALVDGRFGEAEENAPPTRGKDGERDD
jgi:phosphocarrier protein HPr